MWFKVDDMLYAHHKFSGLTMAARGVWLTYGSQTAHNSHSVGAGFVPSRWLRGVKNGSRLAQELVDAGLWEPVEGGWRFHDWEDYQPSQEDIELSRKANRARQEAWRRRQRNAVSNALREQAAARAVTRY